MEHKELELRQQRLRALLDEMYELSQPRTNFALRHFVVGQHDLPARQRHQAIIELQGMMFELARMHDQIRLMELDIADAEDALAKAEGRQGERLQIKIDGLRRDIEASNIMLTGRIRECDALYSMLQEMPKCTAEDLEAEERAYWTARLTRQYFVGQRDIGGNLQAILGMYTEPGKPRPPTFGGINDTLALMGIDTKRLTEGKK